MKKNQVSYMGKNLGFELQFSNAGLSTEIGFVLIFLCGCFYIRF